MEYIGSIIRFGRERVGRSKYAVDINGLVSGGQSQELLSRFLTDAQNHLLAAIIRQRPLAFWREVVFNQVAGQETYPVASPTERILNNTQLITVWYSFTGNKEEYTRLNPRVMYERDTRQGDPQSYIPQDSNILVNPIPVSSRGSFKVSYYLQLDDLRVRSGKITGTPSGTDIVLSATGVLDYAFSQDDADYICISDRFGTPLLYNGIIQSYNAGTHTITLAANVSTYLVSGVTLANLANAYVTVGKWTTTHSKLPDTAERYLRTYLQKRMLTKDSSTDIGEEDSELKTIEADILLGYAQSTGDTPGIPILDASIIY